MTLIELTVGQTFAAAICTLVNRRMPLQIVTEVPQKRSMSEHLDDEVPALVGLVPSSLHVHGSFH